MKFLYSFFLLLLGSIVYADESLPLSCQPIAVQEEPFLLKTKQPLVVVIHNSSHNDLWITHPVSDSGAGAGWSTRLEAGNWSALALDKESFELTCIESKPGHEQQIPCVGMITVCEWPAVKMPSKLKGTFWAGENMTLSALTAHLGNRGFELPASPH